MTIYNNTITNNVGSGLIRPNGGLNVWTVQNNIITNNTGSGIAEENFASNYNDVFNNTAGNYTGGAVAGANDISVDPLFVDVVNNNFRLQAGSPCANTGADLSAQGVTVDVEGTARPQGPAFDRGGYERI